MRALAIHAGPAALARLRERGLAPQDVRVIPAAAGGPKGLVLNPLDRFVFGHWLPAATRTVHLLGASIGAWRMAVACSDDPVSGFEQLADDYIGQHYDHPPGKAPSPALVSAVFGRALRQRLAPHAATILAHPRFRLHVFTSRGRHMLRGAGPVGMPLGYAGAFVANATSRRALGSFLERVVFGDGREPLPFPLDDLRSRQVSLTSDNLCPAILASCSIPFWLLPVRDVPGGPGGAYWDGGITDYHLHLRYSAMDDGLVLYPHFQASIVPGWLDKAWKRRHRASPWLANVVVLAPTPEWVATLPGGRLPDRNDFKRYGDDLPARTKAWRRALAEGERLADEFARFAARPDPGCVQPLR